MLYGTKYDLPMKSSTIHDGVIVGDEVIVGSLLGVLDGEIGRLVGRVDRVDDGADDGICERRLGIWDALRVGILVGVELGIIDGTVQDGTINCNRYMFDSL